MAHRKRARSDDGNDPDQKKKRLRTPSSMVTTRGASRRSLSNVVFLTTELLEIILRSLPMKDLLLAQRVCKKWRAVITSNKRLQQALFSAPADAPFHWEYNRTRHSLVKVPGPASAPAPSSAQSSGTNNSVSYVSATLNPLLLYLDRLCPLSGSLFRILDVAEKNGGEIFGFLSRPSTKHAEASWRRMFLTQPPLKETEGEFYYANKFRLGPHGQRDRVEKAIRLNKIGGLRAWDIMEQVVEGENKVGKMDWEVQWLSADRTLFPTDDEEEMSVIG